MSTNLLYHGFGIVGYSYIQRHPKEVMTVMRGFMAGFHSRSISEDFFLQR